MDEDGGYEEPAQRWSYLDNTYPVPAASCAKASSHQHCVWGGGRSAMSVEDTDANHLHGIWKHYIVLLGYWIQQLLFTIKQWEQTQKENVCYVPQALRSGIRDLKPRCVLNMAASLFVHINLRFTAWCVGIKEILPFSLSAYYWLTVLFLQVRSVCSSLYTQDMKSLTEV